jgi:DNA-binding PadR family transcriptional regulator
MSAAHAILRLLHDKPAYQYELGNQLPRRLGPSWAVNTGQLSQITKRLVEEGLIECVDGASGAREDRRIYAITEKGIVEFDSWWSSTDDPNEPRLAARRSLLVKISLAGPERLAESLELIDSYKEECAQELDQLMKEEAKIVDGPIVRADHEMLRLGLAENIIHKEGQLQWAELARQKVNRLLKEEAIWPSARERAAAAKDEDRRAREELFRQMAAGGQRRDDPHKHGQDDA